MKKKEIKRKGGLAEATRFPPQFATEFALFLCVVFTRFAVRVPVHGFRSDRAGPLASGAAVAGSHGGGPLAHVECGAH